MGPEDIVVLDEFQERRIEQDLVYSLLREQIRLSKNGLLKAVINLLDDNHEDIRELIKGFSQVIVKEYSYHV